MRDFGDIVNMMNGHFSPGKVGKTSFRQNEFLECKTSYDNLIYKGVKHDLTSTMPSCNRPLPAQKYVLRIILSKRVFSKHYLYFFKLSEINAMRRPTQYLPQGNIWFFTLE